MSAPQWAGESATAWMQSGTGVTAVFDYERNGCGFGTHRVYKRSREEAQVHAEAMRDRYLAQHFKCTPIIYRIGA